MTDPNVEDVVQVRAHPYRAAIGCALRILSVAVLLTMAIAACAPPPALRSIDPGAFQAVVAAAAEELSVPGAMVFLRTPRGSVIAPFGTIELGVLTPPAADTHFRIASNTKTMTAALIVLLAQDGALGLDDRVSAHLTGVPDGDNITIAQLLSMRSGLFGYTADPVVAAVLDADPGKTWTPQEVLDIAFRHPPEFQPGTGYDYSNTNYVLLGLIAEKVGGRPLAEQFQQRLFDPVGLEHTALPAVDDPGMPVPYAHGYMYGGSFYALADDPYPADLQAAAEAATVQPVDYTNQNPSYSFAAGAAISTAQDLATWIEALVTGKLFDADHHRQWLDSVQAEDPDAPDGQKYGYGIAYQRFGPDAALYYHGGELPGFNSFMGHDPVNDVTLVVWTNLTLSPDGRTTANAMLPAVLDEIYTGLSLVDRPAAPPTTR